MLLTTGTPVMATGGFGAPCINNCILLLLYYHNIIIIIIIIIMRYACREVEGTPEPASLVIVKWFAFFKQETSEGARWPLWKRGRNLKTRNRNTADATQPPSQNSIALVGGPSRPYRSISTV